MIDLHQDLYLYHSQPAFYPDNDQVSPEQIRELNTKLIIAPAFCGPNSEEQFGVSEMQMWQDALDYYQKLSDFYLLTDSDQLNDSKYSDKTGIIFHLEGIYQEVSISELDDWYQKGLRSIGLTWAEASPYAAGNNSPADSLTKAGAELITWCLDKGILVDLAHMSEKAFFESAEIIDKPLFVSHANARLICDNGYDRNLSDSQLRVIGESGGVVGIFFARSFVNNPTAVIGDVIRHIKHIVDIAGEDSIAIGSDFGGIISNPKISGLGRFSELTNFKTMIDENFGTDFVEKLFYKNAERLMGVYLG